ncbi:head maturation protease, ClpP-related [Seohaeicola saemankumensis]|uniref:ATP-dependent Clp protease proteolytic subunit n=1 Tax=Seohaeicola saemankumensis TaxID=481181 RepID=A0ABW3T835_9RHOB
MSNPAPFMVFGEIGFENCRPEPLGNFLRANPAPAAPEIIINSPGGGAVDGAAMLAEIERHGNAVCRVIGMAASAASLLMLGGREVVMHRDAMVMIHEPASMVFGTSKDFRTAADNLDKFTAIYAAAYARLSGNSEQSIRRWMKDETWLSSEEALALNFCDRVEGGQDPVAYAQFDYGRFRHAPAHLMRIAQQNGWATGSSNVSEKGKIHA